MSSLDARVRYTRAVIEDSFLDMLAEKHLSKISVTELCGRAGINRATFYKHYRDIPDLLERMEEQALNRLTEFLEERQMGEFEEFVSDVLSYMRREGRRYCVLGSERADPELPAKVFELCYQNVYPLLDANLPCLEPEKKRMLYRYLAWGCGGVMTCWLADGMKTEPEEVAKLIMDASIGTVREISER